MSAADADVLENLARMARLGVPLHAVTAKAAIHGISEADLMELIDADRVKSLAELAQSVAAPAEQQLIEEADFTRTADFGEVHDVNLDLIDAAGDICAIVVQKPVKVPVNAEENSLWASAWASSAVASMVVSHWLQRNPEQSCLELGAGIGFTALAAVTASSRCSIDATDVSLSALHFIRRNAERLGLQAQVRACRLDFLRPIVKSQRHKYSFVVGADIMYVESMLKPMLLVAEQLLSPEGVLLLVDAGRPCNVRMLDIAEAKGWNCTRTRHELLGTSFCRMKLCDVYVLTRRVAGGGAASDAAQGLSDSVQAAVAALRERYPETGVEDTSDIAYVWTPPSDTTTE